MPIDINELCRKVNSTDIVDHIDLHANIKPFLSELIDRLEAAEKGRDALRTENSGLVDDMNLLRDNNAALLARIEEMEKQAPRPEWFSWLPEGTTHIDKVDCYLIPHFGFMAYFKAFKYVDGVLYSYRTDSDNENGRWVKADPLYKKGRVPVVYPLHHASGAQPAPSVPDFANTKDAARYRWLRENGLANEKRESRAVLPRSGKKASMAFRYWTPPEELDMTIDAMIAAAPGAKP